MSRCVAFPPPGYVWGGLSGDALVELLQVRRELAEAEKQRKKEERRNKRKKKKEAGEKRHNHHRICHHRKRKETSEGSSDNPTKSESDLQVLGRSNLSKELEQPSLSEFRYESSDSSHNVGRKRLRTFPERSHVHRSIVWIDIRMQNNKDHDNVKIDFVAQERAESDGLYIKELFCSTCGEANPMKEDMKSDTHWRELPPLKTEVDKAELVLESEYQQSCLQCMELEFRDLIVNWVAPSITAENLEFENLEWLFETCCKRPPQSNVDELTHAGKHDLSRTSSSLYPRAQYLPQADTYALLYTTPF